MEGIAWGQWFFGFETPGFWKGINSQKETTLHNIQGISGHSEFFRVIFGVGGFVGILLSFSPKFRKFTPPMILLPYFLIFIVLASMDLYADFYPLPKLVDSGLSRLAEVLEMLIAISAFLYLWFKSKTFATEWDESS